MTDGRTCGQGLAENAALPAACGDLIDALGGILESHVAALDTSDESARRERDVYLDLVERHRSIASRLREAAEGMSGLRDLPMGRHDSAAMVGSKPREAFERFLVAEERLRALLRDRLPADREMLRQMGGTARKS